MTKSELRKAIRCPYCDREIKVKTFKVFGVLAPRLAVHFFPGDRSRGACKGSKRRLADIEAIISGYTVEEMGGVRRGESYRLIHRGAEISPSLHPRGGRIRGRACTR